MYVVEAVTVVVTPVRPSHRYRGQRVVMDSVGFLQTVAHVKTVGQFALAAIRLGLYDTVQQDHLVEHAIKLDGVPAGWVGLG